MGILEIFETASGRRSHIATAPAPSRLPDRHRQLYQQLFSGGGGAADVTNYRYVSAYEAVVVAAAACPVIFLSVNSQSVTDADRCLDVCLAFEDPRVKLAATHIWAYQ